MSKTEDASLRETKSLMRKDATDTGCDEQNGVRTETLHRRGAGDGYNPITGQELKPPAIPPKPRDIGGFHESRGGQAPGAQGIRNNIW